MSWYSQRLKLLLIFPMISLGFGLIPSKLLTIISASELNADQKSQVVTALQANPQNSGKQFTIDYEVDETILGGL